MSDGAVNKMVSVSLDGDDVIVRFATSDRKDAVTLAAAIITMIEGGHLSVSFLEHAPTAPTSDTRQ